MGGSISPARCRPSWTSTGGLVAGRARERRDPTPGSRRLYEGPPTMSGELPSLAEIARRVGITAPTLRRWVASGLVPVDGDGATTAASLAHARVVARLRERGHSLAEIREATESGRLASSYIEGLLPDTPATWTLADAARETGLEASADRAHLRLDGLRRPGAGAPLRRRRAVAALRGRRARRRAAARRLPAARARLRPGDVADRRRRGPALSPLRPRAADARRRPGLADGRGDGGPRARDPAAGLADHGPRAQPVPAALHRAGRHRPHGDRSGRGAAGPRAGCASRSPSPTSQATRA